ncbi:hypothetical protein BDW42DRAFT_177794 [Aspergillus taichungensis]|uniref:Uncharacterized protein n=1 Tax=Aspergillus taichungensis TaxID=482145 RepID=A0A2J5HIM2_9EURO|nr:hypothetical protein BDW42DRAFT_177794 [Aspergillus taichungensis]
MGRKNGFCILFSSHFFFLIAVSDIPYLISHIWYYLALHEMWMDARVTSIRTMTTTLQSVTVSQSVLSIYLYLLCLYFYFRGFLSLFLFLFIFNFLSPSHQLSVIFCYSLESYSSHRESFLSKAHSLISIKYPLPLLFCLRLSISTVRYIHMRVRSFHI